MSNVTNGNVKDWSDELITHCYQLLRNMWGKEHIPQVWKEKWAVLLANTADTSDINNTPRNPCERAGWRSFRGKGPDYTEEQGSSLIVKPVLD